MVPASSKFISYGKQSIDDRDVRAVAEATASELISQGPRTLEFEKELARYAGAKYAVVVSSGTAALHLAALTANLKPGARFWTSPLSFVASANCGLYAGATVDFVDIEPETWNMDTRLLELKLESADKKGLLPQVLIPVHFGGVSCPMKDLAKLATRFGFKIIEDAAHALGGSYQGEKVGAGRYSEMTVYSFHPLKSITTGEGGAILTNDEANYQKLLALRSHGLIKDANQLRENHGPWYYEQQGLGFNYRLTDMQCALGLSQLQRLDNFIGKRRELASLYTQKLRDLPLRVQQQVSEVESAWHIYPIRLNLQAIRKDRRTVFEELRAAAIGVQVHYVPIPAHPFYRDLGFNLTNYPETEKYYDETITLPLHPEMTSDDVDRVVSELNRILGA